jgi:glycine betaine/proline transport system substrate-binding protein
VDYPAAHLAIANGDGTFLADHWDPLHADYYKNAGGDAKLWRDNAYSTGALQGYLIDKKTADQYKITNIASSRTRRSPSCSTPTATARPT